MADRFKKGMKFEEFVETLLRDLDDVRMVKRTDVSSKPHKYEDIKYVPPNPDMTIMMKDGKTLEVWITHKDMPKWKWTKYRERYISSMYWRKKTWTFMRNGQFMIYGILEDAKPYEILWCPVASASYVGDWSDPRDENQDDIRASVNMSESDLLMEDGERAIDSLDEIL